MSGNDYIKYVTEKVVAYMNAPSEHRHTQKEKNNKEENVYSNRWFGVLPFMVKSMIKKG
ncbi:YqzE family protein [Lentibacillus sp. N15]|uniref:YqzE family protein n=1 Tax=Lentibacillus songyuanensis TaxID=3136161 RepID=UPI0031B9B24D